MIVQKTIQLSTAAVFLVASIASAAIWAGERLSSPEHLQTAKGLSKQEAASLLETAQQYYTFWDTGIEDYAKKALAHDFIDLNLPEGRPQGPNGPLVASVGFRQAVPDLTVTVKSVYILKNKVISQLLFKGHFTGTFGKLKGEGQAIRFSAVDMYTIENGKIIENWHLEDNLTLLQQMGVVDNN
jgi:predicted ester cyclase